MAYDVFISYSSRNQAVADAICHELESSGIRCWYAPRNIGAGQSWAGAIISGIRECRIFVLVFSRDSNISQQVLNEVTNAVRNNSVIIPFRIDSSEMNDDMSYYLSSRHWLDAVTPPLQDHMEALRDRVLSFLNQDSRPESRPAPAPRPAGPLVIPKPPRQFLSLASDGIIALNGNGFLWSAGHKFASQISTFRTGSAVEIAANSQCVLVLDKKGKVHILPLGFNSKSEKEDLKTLTSGVSRWRHIVQLRCTSFHTLGLKSDGHVVAAGSNYYRECEVSDWTDIVAIDAYHDYSVGLRSDGTVVARGCNRGNRCEVEGWRDIVGVAAGGCFTAGIRADGTVVTTRPGKNINLPEFNRFVDLDVSGWRNIAALSAGDSFLAGLKQDGTVVIAANKGTPVPDVSYWKNIVSVTTDRYKIAGVKSNGTIAHVSEDTHPYDTEHWNVLGTDEPFLSIEIGGSR